MARPAARIHRPAAERRRRAAARLRRSRRPAASGSSARPALGQRLQHVRARHGGLRRLAATLKPMHAGHYATGVRTIFEAPATLAALAVQPRIYVTDDELGTINIESGGSGELVYVAVARLATRRRWPSTSWRAALVDAHFQGWDEARVAAQKCRWRARVPERAPWLC